MLVGGTGVAQISIFILTVDTHGLRSGRRRSHPCKICIGNHAGTHDSGMKILLRDGTPCSNPNGCIPLRRIVLPCILVTRLVTIICITCLQGESEVLDICIGKCSATARQQHNRHQCKGHKTFHHCKLPPYMLSSEFTYDILYLSLLYLSCRIAAT